MKTKRLLTRIGFSTAALTIFLLMNVGLANAVLVINKPDFSDVSDLTLNGRAGTVGNPVFFNGKNVLRLTDSTSQGGSAFSTSTISLDSDASFSTFFEFQLTDPTGGAADGIVFVVQTVGNNVGGSGGGIGYSGITNSVGVEYDTFDNGSGNNDPNGNHIGINVGGSFNGPTAIVTSAAMDSGINWFSWVDYNGVTDDLEVRLSTTNVRPLAPILTRNVNLVAELGQTNAFVGFTSGTGSASNDHDIRQWKLDNTFNPIQTIPEPGTLVLFCLGLIGIIGYTCRRRKHAE
jgi:hypothetical protein